MLLMKYNPSSVTVDGGNCVKMASSGGWVIWVDDVDVLGAENEYYFIRGKCRSGG